MCICQYKYVGLQKYLTSTLYFIFMTLYVGNIHFSVTNDELADLFSAFGDVRNAKVVMDRETGRSRGFAFVEMGNSDAGNKAIDGMNNALVKGRNLKVNEARPRD
jgi:RNA recognition motif-containing protein